MQIDLQHSNNRKNTLTKLFYSTLGTNNQSSTETTLTTIKNALASIPEKISLANFNNLERKDSNISNDVFYEVKFLNHTPNFKFVFFLTIFRIVQYIL